MATFRKYIFLGFFFGRLAILAGVMLLWIGQAYTNEQAWDLITVVSPIFLSYSIAALTFYLNNGNVPPAEDQEIAAPVRSVTYIVIVLYPVLCLFFIVYFASLAGDESQFAALKKWLGIAEIAVASYLGLVVAKLFPTKA